MGSLPSADDGNRKKLPRSIHPQDTEGIHNGLQKPTPAARPRWPGLGQDQCFIKWKDGTSNVWAPESGQAEFTGSGEIEYIEVAGQKHYQHQRVNNDGVIVIRKH